MATVVVNRTRSVVHGKSLCSALQTLATAIIALYAVEIAPQVGAPQAAKVEILPDR
jgi:hypothetical protein